jgi:3-methylcrotonyl-CoA carboxylase alpha subunit
MTVTVNGKAPAEDARVLATGGCAYVLRGGRQTIVRLQDFAAIDRDDSAGTGVIRAPLHGKVLAILVEPGVGVERGQKLAIVEAMKMEHTLTAPRSGTVTALAVAVGDQVAEGASLMTIAPAMQQEDGR